LASGQNIILQGLRKLKYLAQANMIGAFAGLVFSIPLYYFYGSEGVVPAIVISSFVSLFIAIFYSKKVAIKSFPATKKETLLEGKDMLRLGFMLSLSGLISVGASYLLRIYISNTGSIEDVGLYNAGFAIIGTYVGLVFTAMGTDYFPRLSNIAHDNSKAKELINQQAEIAILILAPILVIFLVFINWVIILLYSQKFVAINEMLLWATLGMFFKAASWSVGYLFLAKGDSKLFFWSELLANFYVLVLGVFGYHYFGLEGLGVSFLVSYVLLFFQVFFIAKKYYAFNFNTVFCKIFFIQIFIGVCCFIAVKFITNSYVYMVGSFLILISVWFSYKELNKRLNITEIISNLKNKL
jgi:O-antigen/teichoic acid export membrane protein